jgi:hypothetical protein
VTAEPRPDEQIEAAIDHLQGAARELIAAARVLLDVAEELVDDPAPVVEWLAALADLGRSVMPSTRPADGRGQEEDSGPRRAPRVQHIRVS